MIEFSDVFGFILSIILSLILIAVCFFAIIGCAACIHGMYLDIRKWIRRER
jgi:hypothetical protein